MTQVIATVAPDVGVLSADTLIYSAHAVGPMKHAELDATPESYVRATYCGDGKPPVVVPTGFGRKVVPIPHLKMAIATGGAVPLGLGWAMQVKAMQGIEDITDLDDIATAMLSHLAGLVGGYSTLLVIHVGWSAREGRIIGRMFRSETGFVPEVFEGHRFAIIPYPYAHDYAEILAAFELASRGESVEEFHTAIARNVDDAYQAGRVLKWLHIGGDLVTVRIDRSGVTVTSPYAFQRKAELMRGMPLALLRPSGPLAALGIQEMPQANPFQTRGEP